MINLKLFISFLLAFELYCATGFSLIYCKIILINNQGFQLELNLDLHNLGDKCQNLKQMDYFLAGLEKNEEPVHIYVESKFFYGFDSSQGIDIFYQNLSRILNYEADWSYENSPQDASATTWIAWELPHRLLGCNKYISYEFCDPRLALEPQIATSDAYQQIKISVEDNLDKSKKSSPKKTAKTISNLFSNEAAAEDDLLFHKMLASKILNGLQIPNLKKIIVVCGAHHGLFLADNFLPLLGFEKIESMALPVSEIRIYQDGTAISNAHFEQGCNILNLSSEAKMKSKPSAARKLVF